MNEQNVELMNDLHQFLYDARDQVLLLENTRAHLSDLFDTSTAREERLNRILSQIERDVRTGINIKIDAELSKTIESFRNAQARCIALQETSTKALITAAALSIATAITLVASTIYTAL